MKRSVAFALVTTATSMLVALSTASAGAAGLTVLAPSIAPPDSPAQSADRMVEAEPALLRASDKDRFQRHSSIAGKGGLTYVSYTRTYSGLPVYGGDFVVVTNPSGGVLSTSIAQTETLNVATTPKIDAQQAAEIAKAEITDTAEVSEPKLSVMAEGSGRLAYEVVVHGTDNGHESKLHVFVDALTGEIAEKSDEVKEGQGSSYYNGPVTIGTTLSGSTYSMTDPARSGLRCGGQGGTAYTGPDDSWGNATGTNLETACVDALYAAGKEWDMLSAWLGRNGINGTGGGFPARVGLSDVNAYWNGSYTNFGRSQDNQRQATPIDVVAHEFGHAIFQTTPGGSTGSNEKGGLNESTGDIFGALTEFYANEPAQYDPPDLSVGEEVNLVGNGPIRYMHKPSQISGHPDCYSSSVPNLEVHAGAGVQNHWFYLLSQGTNPTNGQPVSPTCNSSTVTGVGIQKAGQIFMGALQRKTTAWTHLLVRKASLEAAIQLFPGSCAEFNTTKAAWAAVNVPAATGEPTSCSAGNDFSLTLSPTSANVQPGQQATTTVGTTTTSGSAQSVTFSASGLPSGATAAFSPASVTSGASSTLTISVPAGTASGTYNVIVTGDGASVDRTATFTLTVGTAGNVVFNDTFETALGWTTNASGTDTATSGAWERGDPAATTSAGTGLQLGTTVSGTNGLVTGRLAGTAAGDYDVDGGLTSIRSPEIALPSGTLTLSLSWYLAHLNNAGSGDYFRVRVVSGTTSTVVFQQLGAASNRAGAWQTATVNLSGYAGQSVRLLIEAADTSTASLIEAGVDDVKITTS
ncbi:M4 family metallopeptidase [Streptosporangium sp. NBC_01639]|uniref:M4 family metallopeptidase n=1 Tax=unclassified Streptosporangium TaxID=2632669 RepID=UPI002DDBD7B0|nr:M4 family metallopeptidase [Streptosporangium sp. NBC_01756]WSC86987.1 M4 family metallopeptidase [Streptosporangium sp. NBC_01756]WTD54323.1 M4 family metallopeptidase [Streptosporangium sp. NBC_01639]